MALVPSLRLVGIIGSMVGLSELCLNLVKRAKATAVTKDRHSLKLIWILNMGGCWLGMYCAVLLPSLAFPWREQVVLSGLCLCVLGLTLRWYAIIYLGRFFTVNVAIATDHRLIDSGPYRWIRHPSYAGGLLIVLGFGLCMGNIASLLIFMTCFLIACLRRIQVEEQALIEAFGGQYRDYMQRTKRLIPFVY